jgi:hypothetical protein
MEASNLDVLTTSKTVRFETYMIRNATENLLYTAVSALCSNSVVYPVKGNCS